jgi:hypothetical protein
MLITIIFRYIIFDITGKNKSRLLHAPTNSLHGFGSISSISCLCGEFAVTDITDNVLERKQVLLKCEFHKILTSVYFSIPNVSVNYFLVNHTYFCDFCWHQLNLFLLLHAWSLSSELICTTQPVSLNFSSAHFLYKMVLGVLGGNELLKLAIPMCIF